MNSTVINVFKKAASFLALKAGKKVYRNGGILGGAIAGIIAVGALASGIRKKRNKQQKKISSNKKIVV